jgi:hypothetical protein
LYVPAGAQETTAPSVDFITFSLKADYRKTVSHASGSGVYNMTIEYASSHSALRLERQAHFRLHDVLLVGGQMALDAAGPERRRSRRSGHTRGPDRRQLL